MQSLCNDALKVAVDDHDFNPLRVETDRTCVADQAYVTLPTDIIELLAVRGRDSAAGVSWPVTVKSVSWWETYIGTSSDEGSHRPVLAAEDKANSNLLIFPPPSTTDYHIIMLATSYPSFAGDATENPVPVLDQWLIDWVTHRIFKSLQLHNDSDYWKRAAIMSMKRAKLSDLRQPAKDRVAGKRSLIRRSNHPISPGIVTTGYVCNGNDLSGTFWR
jgi:hypothetical protein